MNDTSAEIQEVYESMLMKLTGEERLIRAALMFDAVRELVLASLPKDLPPGELRRRVYERIYGEPLPSAFPGTPTTRDLPCYSS